LYIQYKDSNKTFSISTSAKIM